MIVSDITDSSKYDAVDTGIAMALEWLRNNSGTDFVTGIYSIGQTAAGEVYAKCEEPPLVPREKAALEAHHRYIDIHVPLKGPETIGWAPTASLKHLRTPYDEEKDVEFYGDSAQALIHLKPGQCAVFFPEDSHAPNIGLGKHRKLCIKIPVEV